MRRELVLTLVLAVGALSMAVAAQRGAPPTAQGPRVVEIDKISDRFVGKGGGGNTAISLTANGTVLVDW